MMMMPGSPMTPHYDFRVVILSIVIATVSSFVALLLADRVSQADDRLRFLWLISGALSMGTGIWSMHFTGMLAYHLPIGISYNIPMVLLSLVAAVAASGVALSTLSRPILQVRLWITSGFLMGSGIVSMHYIGMWAMRLAAKPIWDFRIIFLSAAIAIGASLIALRFAHALRGRHSNKAKYMRFAAALIMGFAIAGMHYTGMAAASFIASVAPHITSTDISAEVLGNGAVAIVTIVILILVMAAVYVDRQFEASRATLAQAQQNFQAVMANAPVLLFLIDCDGCIAMAEGRELSRIGFDVTNAVGCAFNAFFHEVPSWVTQADRALGGEEFSAVAEVRGSLIEMRWTTVRHERSVGQNVAVIAVGTDITERRRAEQKLQHQAFHDSLTGLPNRASVNWRLDSAIAEARSKNVGLAFAILDLNRFKTVNDTLGHEVGDELLKSAGIRIANVIRGGDFAGRLGGDEFAIVLWGTAGINLSEVGNRIAASFEKPFECNGHTLSVGASIGFAHLSEQSPDASTLMRHADDAMYVAKRSGCDYFIFGDDTSIVHELVDGSNREESSTSDCVCITNKIKTCLAIQHYSKLGTERADSLREPEIQASRR